MVSAMISRYIIGVNCFINQSICDLVFRFLLRFIEGDFDAYVKSIQQPYVWGGEPELLMASHVLK